MKYIIGIIGGVIVLGAGYYLISPLFNTIAVNDELPEAVVPADSALMPSGVEALTPEERLVLETAMTLANDAEALPLEDTMPAMPGDDGQPAVRKEPLSAPVVPTLGHPAEGTVRVIDTVDGQVIRYENFSTINGPQLHVYLAKDLDAKEYLDLGPIRGTEGNINYTVPEGVDLSEYRYVMYWCVPFGVLFNYADISGV